ncbi:MAG TPA: hypothetical protein GX707_15980 [Epulopiscium sp.]|nr:hypothetical protein [Candidatus Epulonipiscium sp.]
MPREARLISSTGKYHIVVKSLKEIDLFRDSQDKTKYLEIINKYKVKYGFTLYAYCLMGNHGHYIIDCLGADLSTVIGCINLSYSQYYNRKYDRYGPVFKGRFHSTPIENDRYMITVSAYIHNNPKDIPRYKEKVQLYPFSSLIEYINETNESGVLTRSFLVELIGFKHKQNKKAYLKLIRKSADLETEMDIEFTKVKSEYRSEKTFVARTHVPGEIIDYVAKKLNQHPQDIYVKYRREYTKIRAITCLLMSNFCNMGHRQICQVMGNMTQSGIAYLTAKGLGIVMAEREFIEDFVSIATSS